MEPLVIFGAGLVIYCGYLAFMDEIREFQLFWKSLKKESSRKSRVLKASKAGRTIRPLSVRFRNA